MNLELMMRMLISSSVLNLKYLLINNNQMLDLLSNYFFNELEDLFNASLSRFIRISFEIYMKIFYIWYTSSQTASL